MRTIVLASASPRRAELVSLLGIPYIVLASGVDETALGRGEASRSSADSGKSSPDPGLETPREHTARLAESKAKAVFERIITGREEARRDAASELALIVSRIDAFGELWVVGADTVIDLDGTPIGKPSDEPHARAILGRLSRREHEVITSLALLVGSDDAYTIDVASEATRVEFGALTEAEIDDYLATAEWRDVAGAYRIQSRGEALVDSIHGSFTNVVGLPLRRFRGMLTRRGYF